MRNGGRVTRDREPRGGDLRNLGGKKVMNEALSSETCWGWRGEGKAIPPTISLIKYCS